MKQFNHFKHSLLLMLLAIGVSWQSRAMTCGTYTVGAGGDFPDLATAVTDLNGSTITCPVIINILPGTYSGSQWQAVLTAISGASSTNTITIQAQAGPSSVTISVAGSSSANYVIKLSDADYITIKNLSLENTSSSNGRVIDIAGTSSHNVVMNCTLTGATGSASSDARSIVTLGSSSAALSGADNVVTGNTIKNGYDGIHIIGTSAATTNNNQVTNNTVTDPYVYGIYASYAGNLSLTSNTVTGTNTSFTHGIYLNYLQNGGNISSNNVTINTTTGTHYGMYNNYVNSSSSTVTTINNNNFSVTTTSGTGYTLYNYYSNYISFAGNNFTAVASSGTVYQPFVAYYGANITATGNTFTTTCGSSGGINNTTSYYFIYNGVTSSPNNIIVRDNIFNFNSSGGGIGTSSSGNYHMYYPNECRINKNKYNVNASSSVTMYGFGGYYWMYYGTNTTFDSNKITINAPSGGSFYNISYPYGMYYGSGNSISYDSVIATYSSGTLYALGYYQPYGSTNPKINNNYINATTTSGSYYMAYYFPYSCTNFELKNNTSIVNSSGSGTIYNPAYIFGYSGSGQMDNNTFTTNTVSGSVYSPYYYMYSIGGSTAKNNTFNVNASSSATVYVSYYYMYGGSGDTVDNNVWNVNTTGTIYNYWYYVNNLTKNCTWNLNTTSGTIYFQWNYAQQALLMNNRFNLKTTTGTLYGMYEYPYGGTGYGFTAVNNIWDLRTTSGTIYGYYNVSGYGTGKNSFIGNVMSAKSNTGSVYLYNNNYGNYDEVKLFNNTFHGNTGSSTCQLFYHSGSSSSYPGKMWLYNNIFSRSNAASGNAIDINDTAYFKSDYNLLYSPGTVTLRTANPAVVATTMGAWQTGTGQDMNSLFYDPAYMDANNVDFRPNPASPNSWSVQGRGIHLPGDTLDILGNPRAKTRFDGVPDLGAYEFTPTSTPPDAVAIPSNPVANSTQKFVFGGDTVCSIDWGNTVPTSIAVKQYTGLQANVTPSITERMYFYVDVQAPLGVYEYTPRINYKDPWLGNISTESNARIAKSSNGGLWAGHNYTNGITDSVRNALMPAYAFDSLSSKFTGVENARIGIRCIVPPYGLIHYNVTAFDATEQWEPVFVPIGYQIIVDSVQSPLDLTKIQFTSTNNPPTYPISNLVENTTYYVNVRTICGAKDTSSWSVDSFRTMITCHDPVISTTSVTHDQAVVYWDTIQTAIAYEYRIDQTSGAPAFGTKIGNNYVLAGGLKPGTTYYAHVRSFCGTIYDQSGWSEHKFTTKWPVSVEELNGAARITAFPNPVKDVVTISLFRKPAGDATISINDITGKVVYYSNIVSDKMEIDMRGMPAGMYTVKYNDTEYSEVIKILKD